jgi:tripartite-type tricarboxylate transporter receptor subunit TctC
LTLAAAAAALPAVSRIARAQAYPTRPITMIVPFPAGGGADLNGRVVAERMSSSLGRPIIIENISGADGSIGTGRAARARPDGFTIIVGQTSTFVLNGAVYSLQYDLLNDFAPVSPLAATPVFLFARKTLLANSLSELIAWVKANPAFAGIQTMGSRLLMAFFQKEIGTQFTLVPYRGNAPAMQDLMAGHIDLAFAGGDSLPLMQAGNVKAYAVASDTRVANAPDIPTFAEMGLLTLSYSEWFGLFAPKGTPRDIIRKAQRSGRRGIGRSGSAITHRRGLVRHSPAGAADAGRTHGARERRYREMVAAHQGVWNQSRVTKKLRP